jgi:hypothetical protein
VELTLNAKCTGDTTMDIYTRDLVRSGHGTIGTPVIAGTIEFLDIPDLQMLKVKEC